MNLLALDTSSNACSVALQCGADVSARHEERPREHTRLLLPMIRDQLGTAGIEAADLEAIVLGNGPGSFIGMRIAASVAQGLAYAAGIKIVPVSSLAAVAMQVLTDDVTAEVIVAQDARMAQVYLGRYVANEQGLAVPLAAEQIHDVAPLDLPIAGRAERIVAAGQGWQRYPELLELNRQQITELSVAHYPRALDLLQLGKTALQSGLAIEPQEIVPAYLRQKVAEKPATAP